MAEDGGDGSDELRVPFVFVPNGAPDPVEWMAAHPGWFRVPATLPPDPRRFTHPDAALPTRDLPAGTPISLGAIVPGVSRTSLFLRPERFPRETTPRDDSVEQYLRISQMMQEASRAYAPPSSAAPAPTATSVQPIGSASHAITGGARSHEQGAAAGDVTKPHTAAAEPSAAS